MKKITYIILLGTCIIFGGIIYFQHTTRLVENDRKIQVDSTQRIISLSPNVTEILFALGLGDKIVGVTRFCSYPPEVKEKMKVGGYLDPNYEAIVSLKPDVVVLLSGFESIKNSLSELGIKYLEVDNKTVAEIMESIDYLGKQFSVEQQAKAILAEMRSKIERIKQKTSHSDRPKVLIVVERTPGTGTIEDVYVAGKNTFYDELINMAGGINAFEDEKIAYPIVSAEGIIHLNPEFIIDLIPQLQQTGVSTTTLEKDWASLPQIDAVENNQVHILSQDYAVIPGPRFILFLEDLTRMIHPEIDWSFD
jgi:iron complex transport system substrate-binding protein